MSAADKLHEFAEMLAAASRGRSQAASTVAEPSQTNTIAPENTTVDGGPVNDLTTANQPLSPLADLDLDTAIRLRWALRDIKAKRTKLTPVNPDDLKTLIEVDLVEMRDDVPVLTNEGHRAID
ncbi:MULTISPECIES: hypothetical protein [unclassified Bradyrhizobium]|uniref:hypothetical protein n=1 Tax=unclassified Bradyrhizobium TaxID=2631580 RepID=UPI002FF35BEF